MEAGRRIDALPGAERLHDLLDFLVLVLQALARVDVGDVHDGLERRVEHAGDRVQVPAAVEEVTDLQRLQPGVAVQLLVIGVGDRLEAVLVLRRQHGHGVATEVGAGHGDDVRLAGGDEPGELAAQHVVRVAADVVELVHRDQALVEGGDAVGLHREAEGGMGADQHLVAALQESPDRAHLALVGAHFVIARRITQVPLRLDLPVGEEAVLAQRLVGEAATDGLLRHHDDGLLEALVVQLVQRDEHQRARLAGGRRRLDQQVLLATLGVGALLHRAHAQRIDLAGRAGARGGDRDRRDRAVAFACHFAFPLFGLALSAVIRVYSSNSFSSRSVSFLNFRPI